MKYATKIMPAWDVIDWEDYKEREKSKHLGGELNAFKEDPEYMEELPGQMSFDDFMLDDIG